MFGSMAGWRSSRAQPWVVGDVTYAPDTLLVIRLDEFLAGERSFHVLFTPEPRRSLQNFGFVGGSLLVGLLDELRPVIQVVQPGTWTTHTLDGMPKRWEQPAPGAWISRSTEADGTLLATVQDPLTPATLMMIPPGPAAARDPEAESHGVRCNRFGGDPARGDLKRRRTHSLRPGGAAG